MHYFFYQKNKLFIEGLLKRNRVFLFQKRIRSLFFENILYVERCGVEVWSKFGRSLVEVWSKFGRSLVEQFGRHFIRFIMCFIDIPSKLRPNFDTGGVEVWSKFGRSFDTGGVEVWSKF